MAVGEVITTSSCFTRKQFVFWFTFCNIIWCLWTQQFISAASHVLVKQQKAVCVFQTHTVCFRVGIHFKYKSRYKCVALSWRCASWVEKNEKNPLSVTNTPKHTHTNVLSVFTFEHKNNQISTLSCSETLSVSLWWHQLLWLAALSADCVCWERAAARFLCFWSSFSCSKSSNTDCCGCTEHLCVWVWEFPLSLTFWKDLGCVCVSAFVCVCKWNSTPIIKKTLEPGGNHGNAVNIPSRAALTKKNTTTIGPTEKHPKNWAEVSGVTLKALRVLPRFKSFDWLLV